MSPSPSSPVAPVAPEVNRALEDTLLVCIDLQPVFIKAVVDRERLQKRCEFAIAAAQGLGLPVLFTEQVPEKLGATVPALRALAPNARSYPKRTFSAFGDDATREAILQGHRAEHLLLCGIETSVCVYQTAIAALSQGLKVTILSDAVSARRSEDARTCLESLARSGAHVLPAETVFYSLVHDVGHPFFKAYTQLVKNAG